jgi:hypothetical protein
MGAGRSRPAALSGADLPPPQPRFGRDDFLRCAAEVGGPHTQFAVCNFCKHHRVPRTSHVTGQWAVALLLLVQCSSAALLIVDDWR